MKKKILVLLLTLALFASFSVGAVSAFATEPEPAPLTVVAVNYSSDLSGFGKAIAIEVSSATETYREALAAEETAKITMENSAGESIPVVLAETWGSNFAINRGTATPAIGDKITIASGFTYGGATSVQEYVYYYTTINAPWTTTPPAPPEPPKDDIAIGIISPYCHKKENWAPAMQVTITGVTDEYSPYWGGTVQNVVFTSAFGNEMEIEDIVHVGSYNFIVRLKDKSYNFRLGDKLAFKAGFFLRAHEKLAEDTTFVVVKNSDDQMKLLADVTFATSFTIDNPDIDKELPIEADLKIDFTIPKDTVGTPLFTSSDVTKATVTKDGVVTGVAEGAVTITGKLGEFTTTFVMSIIPKADIETVSYVDVYDVHVVKGQEFKLPTDFTARVKYVGGRTSIAFSLVEGENLIVPAISTENVGKQSINVKIVFKEVEYAAKLNVIVYEPTDLTIKEVGIVDWFSYAMFVQVPDSSVNLGNIQSGTLLSDLLSFVKYAREDGTNVPVDGVMNLGTNVVLIPFNNLTEANYNDYFLAGDKLTLKAGFYNLLWTGRIAATETDNNAMAAHTGMVIVENVLKEDVVYRYDGSTWGRYIEYSGIAVASASTSVVIGKTASAGVSRLPANATVGTITYTSSDATIASVNNLGVIRGLKAGKATITATITGGLAGEKTITLEVNVVDAIIGLEFSTATATATIGGNFTLDGITAKYKMASGATGEAVDLTGAEITGFDNTVEGEQTVVVSVTINGVKHTGSIIVTVKAAAKTGCGCKSQVNVSATIAIGVVLLVLACLALVKRKSTSKKDTK